MNQSCLNTNFKLSKLKTRFILNNPKTQATGKIRINATIVEIHIKKAEKTNKGQSDKSKSTVRKVFRQ